MNKFLLTALFVVFALNDLKSQWIAGNEPTGDRVYCLGNIGSNILASTLTGFYISTDNGQTWFISGNGLPVSAEVRAFAQSGSDIYAGIYGSGVYVSSDSGLNWTPFNTGLVNLYVRCLAANGTTIFAGTTSGLYTSNIGTAGWSISSSGISSTTGVESICIKGNSIFIGLTTLSGVFKSTNNGASWTACNNGTNSNVFYSMLAYGNTIFGGGPAGIYQSSNDGNLWTFCSQDINNNFMGQMLLASSGSIIYAATHVGVFFSTNGGFNWTNISGGYDALSIITINGVVHLGNSNTGISKFNGTDWDYINIISTVNAIATNGTTIYAGLYSTDGPFISTDNGASWNSSYNGMNDIAIESMLISGSTIYAATTNDGVYMSSNNGANWIPINNGLTSLSTYKIIRDGSILYVGTYGGIFKSVNNGLYWSILGTVGSTSNRIFDLAIVGTNFYAATISGVFLSTNNGANWTNIYPGMSYYPKTIDVYNSTLLVGTDGGGVFRSINNGTTWDSSNTGLSTFNDIEEIVRHGSNIFLASTSHAAGVFLSVDDGLSWNQLDSGTYYGAYSLGLNSTTIFAGAGTVYRKPLADIISCLASINAQGSTAICSTGTVTLNADTGTNFSYQWKLGGVNIPGANGASYLANAPGNYSCDVTMSCGTVATNDINVGMNIPPTIIEDPSSTHICSGSNTLFNVVAAGNGLSYQWKDNGVAIINDSVFSGATTSSLTLTNALTNTNLHQYTCVVTDACLNSFSSGAATLTVDSSVSPFVSITGPATVCTGSNATFTASPVNQGLNPTYQWKKNGLIVGGNTISYSTTSLVNGDVIYITITNTDSCVSPRTVSSNSITINIPPVVVPTITNNSGQLMSSAASGYQWYSNGLQISGANSQSYSPQSNGVYTVRITDVNGCSVSSGVYLINYFTPVPVITAAGHWHSMFLCADGTVNAWGRNDEQQLGDTISTDRFLPVQVAGLSDITSIAVKFKTSMALKSDSTVWVWGLLNGATPVQITGLSKIINIAAGNEHCMALKSDSTVWNWGYNTYGQLGNGNMNPNFTPAQVSGISGVVDISGGDYHSLALKADGTVWGWGNNDYGCLGDGTMNQRNHPVQVQGLNNVVSISCGLYFNYALKSDGTIWAWGENSNGKLGDSTQTTRLTPVQVKGLTNMIAVVAGQYNGLAIKSDSTVWAWGDNNNAQLGNGNQVDQLKAIQVPNIDSVVAVAAGGYQSFALKADGSLWAWGSNQVGELGNTSVIGIAFAPVQTMGLCNFGTAVNQINSDKGSIIIYPNPSNGKFIFSNTNSDKGSIKVYDAFGQLIVDDLNIAGVNTTIDLSTQPKGIYFAVINSDGKMMSRKLVVE